MVKTLTNALNGSLAVLLAASTGCGGNGSSRSDTINDSLIPAAKLSAGCRATSGLLTASDTYTMPFNDINRTFRLHVPKNYNSASPSPVIIVFHGWGGTQNEFLANATVKSQADQRGYIVVAPLGLGSGSPDSSHNSWSFSGSTTGLDGDDGSGIEGAVCDYTKTANYNYSSCGAIEQNTCAWTQCQQDDVAFTKALVDHINSKMCIATDHVFASGGSNGGMLTWELGQNPLTAPLFRAIAPIIGLPHRGYLAAQGKNEALPVLLITGKSDPTVPPGAWDDTSFTTTTDGDFFYYAGATGITKTWAQALGCDVSTNAVAFDDSYEETDCRTYCSNDQGWPRVLDCRANMAHDYQLSWSWKLVMDFFDQHSFSAF